MSGKRRRAGDAADAPPLLPTLSHEPTAAAAASSSASLAIAAPQPPLDHNGLEALGLAQEQARRRESTGSLSSKYWLSLSPQPPRHPFVNVWFPIKVFLVDSKKSLKSGWPLRLSVELLYENGEVVPNQSACVEVQGCSEDKLPALGPNGSVDLKVRVLTVSMAHENKAFFLRFSAAPHDKGMVPSHISILPATSTIMNVIRHRLHITEQPPATWYKDEGGRDKCISVTAALLDEHEQPVAGREVPIRVVLCYEGDECAEVKNQSILKSPLEATSKVDRYGKVSVRVRIEEVSKNHQRQQFVLKLVPDVLVSPDFGDISPDVSSPITVLSKRNKRRPKHGADEQDSPELGAQVGPSAAAAAMFNPSVFSLAPSVATMPLGQAYQRQQAAQAAAAAAAAAAATTPFAAAPSTLSTVAHASSSVLPSITPTGGPAAPPAASSSLSQTSLNGHMMARLASADAESAAAAARAGAGVGAHDTIGHLISAVAPPLINWCQHVHDLLSKIEWQHVGFEVQEDGQMNLHRPLYRCPSCWSYQDTIRQTGHRDSCKLSKLSSAYRTHVHVYLQDLLNSSSSAGASSSLPYASPSGNNPGALATANSLMAAYSKNAHSQAGAGGGGGSVSGSYMLDHSMSRSGSNANAAAAAHVRNQFPLPSINSVINSSPVGGTGGLMHMLSGSGLPRALSPPARLPSTIVKMSSLGVSGSGSGSGGGGGGAAAANNAADQMLSDSMRDVGAASSDGEPASKKLKTQPSATAAPSSAALFPPANDWQNLSAMPMEPVSSPPLHFDRGISALDLATQMAMAAAGTQSQQGGGGNHAGDIMRAAHTAPAGYPQSLSAPDPNGLVGATPFAHLSAYQDPTRPQSTSPTPGGGGGGGGGGGFAGSDSLPDRGLTLLRAGSSINLNNLDSYMQGQADEAVVDAIHVTNTAFGFPAFGAATAAPAASASASSSPSPPSVIYPLCGFYQYDESTSFLIFVPLSRFTSGANGNGIRADQVTEMERIFAQMRADGHEQSPATRILTRAQTITLEKLREEALLLHYATSSGFLANESADAF